MRQKIDIAIAEDHEIVRQGLIRMLNDFDTVNILFEVSNGKELLQELKKTKPTIILLDMAMPVLSGLNTLQKIKERYPKIKIIVISAYCQDTSIIEYVKLGANSCLPKDCNIKMLITAIHTVYDKGYYFDDSMLKLLAKHGISPPGYSSDRELTQREIIVLKFFCINKPYEEISDLMGIQIKTIDWYKHILFQKTKCKDMNELREYAKLNQLI